MGEKNNKIGLACIIDDDSLYTYNAKKILKESPVFNDYIIFNDAESAIEHFKTVSINDSTKIPDVLFLDINMPIMDGWDFIDEFSKLKPSLKKNVTIYMVSSSINPADINRAKELSDVAQYIVKPINVEQFEKIFKFFQIEAA